MTFYEPGDEEGQVWMCGRDKTGPVERPMPYARVERYLSRLRPDHADRVRQRIANEKIDIKQGVIPTVLFAGEETKPIATHVMIGCRQKWAAMNTGG